MVFLENEIYQTFGKKEMWYASEYLDFMFDQGINDENTERLEILLGL